MSIFKNKSSLLFLSSILLLSSNSYPQPAAAIQPASATMSAADRERALGILDNVTKGIKDIYWDPKMNGVDWDEAIVKAKAKISDAKSMNEALMQIAIAVSSLNDSHTTFTPAVRPYHLDFGFAYQMILNGCFITHVRPGSDAEAKGLKPGDQIMTIDSIVPSRSRLRNIQYLINTLDPKPELKLQIRRPTGDQQDLVIQAKMSMSADLAYRNGGGVLYDVERSGENTRHRMRMQFAEVGDIGILKVPWVYYPLSELDAMNAKIRKDRAVIVDMRGDPGGSVYTLKYLVGMFFDHEIKIADQVERKKTETQVAKGDKNHYFPGKVIVLVDSECASAAEIFSRVVQLEKRGKVIGDRTSGSVMEATNFYFASSGVDYGAEVTIANLIMNDGKSLEHYGVLPDELLVPQTADLRLGRDPVLSQAVSELGGSITPADAGKLFEYEWPKE